jgi:glycosyltransferase involved in cell wall biosynthesis
MRILMLHNRYRHFGGEDAVAIAEAKLLRERGHTVLAPEFNNEVSTGQMKDSLRLGLHAAWSRDSYRQVEQLCRQFKPDVAHVHNFWARMSPSVHAACRAQRVPTVQTLHNFRLLCLNAQCLRNSRSCEDCIGRVPWRGLVRRCDNHSLFRSSATFGMIMVNRLRRTWQNDVNAYIVMTAQAKELLRRGGVPAERIFLKPNFVDDVPVISTPPSSCRTIAYVGRLSKEKGVGDLLSAWAQADLGHHGELHVIGDGPAHATLRQQAAALGFSEPEVRFLGWRQPEEIRSLLAQTTALVLPSLWYEECPMALLEAFAAGRSAIVYDLGGLRELVQDQSTGLKAAPGDIHSLATALRAMLTQPGLADRLGSHARARYLAEFSPGRNYEALMRIYESACSDSHARREA